jgi:hypothetical protein
MVVHSEFFFILCIALSMIYSSSKRFFTKKPQPKKRERELTTVEVVAWFSIGFSIIFIFGFVASKGLLNSTAFIIPMGIILLAWRLLDFAKGWAALQTSRSASN